MKEQEHNQRIANETGIDLETVTAVRSDLNYKKLFEHFKDMMDKKVLNPYFQIITGYKKLGIDIRQELEKYPDDYGFTLESFDKMILTEDQLSILFDGIHEAHSIECEKINYQQNGDGR